MRRITAGLFISLDGVVEEPGDWHFPYFNDEMGVAVDSQIDAADTLLLGRKTYDSFAGAWPDREAAGGEDASFAKVLGDQRKIVVSNQNLQFTWRNSEQLKGELVGTGGGLRSHGGPPRCGERRVLAARSACMRSGGRCGEGVGSRVWPRTGPIPRTRAGWPRPCFLPRPCSEIRSLRRWRRGCRARDTPPHLMQGAAFLSG